MSQYNAIKAAVNAYIKANGRKEITGQILNSVLNAAIDSLGKFYQFAGEARPDTDPGTPDQNVTYLAGVPGTYTDFGGLVVDEQEIALLMWNGTWAKHTMLIGIREVTASVDNQVGTPSVDVNYENAELSLSFHNLKGNTGDAAGFGSVSADVDANIGTPSVSVESSGGNTAKNFTFHFKNLKGQQGDTGVTAVSASVDNNTGVPYVEASLSGQTLVLAFHNMKGQQGDTGSSVDYPYTLVNDVTTNDATQGLAASVGVYLQEEIDQLSIRLYGEGDVVLDLTSYPEAVGTISGAKFYDTGGNYPNWRYILIPVSVYHNRTMRIVPHSSSDSTTYAFLTDDVLVHNTNVNFATGYTQPVSSAVTFDVVVPIDANYLFLRAENVSTLKVYLPQSLTILAITGDIDKKVDKVAGKGLSSNDYTDADKAKVASIPNTFVSPSDLDNYVPKAQGIENAGLLLKVGADGKVTLGTGGGTQPDVSDCVQKKVSHTLYLGANILAGTAGAGTGWTESAGAYTHESGAKTTLEFPLNTDSGDAYVAILSSNIAGNKEESLLVSIGDGVPCDTYNGTTGPFYVGMVSDGGYLKITADSTYTGTISGVELRKIVSEEDADISVTLNTDNNKHYENVDAGTTIANITGWWNVAIGATDAMKSNQNGSRNIAIGQRSLSSMQGGTRNIGIGTFALTRLVYGARNIAIGADSAWYITNGYDNVAIGKAAFGEIRGTTPSNNIAIGTSALSQNTNENPENNVAIGTNALAGGSNSTAKTHCVAIGVSAGRSNNTKCVAVGENAGFYVTGQGNVAVGYDAMNYYNVDGQNNICIGHLARLYPPSRPATINNAIAIGYNAKATKSNQVVIGNASHTEFVLGDKKLVFNNDNTISWETIS